MRPSDVKAAVVTAVVSVGVIVAIAVASALSGHEPKVTEEPATPPAADSDSSTDADAVTVMDLDEPFVCMVNLDCLLDAIVSSETPVPPHPVPPPVVDDT